jgi:NAD(P)H-hydrate epimerase
MKIFTTSLISEIDRYTILHEPISDVDLMERASRAIADCIVGQTAFHGDVFVFCGTGNNGGDGLAVARMLASLESRFSLNVFIIDQGKGLNGSPAINFERLKTQAKSQINFIRDEADFPVLNDDILVIDALFGNGLNRPLEGLAASLVRSINNSGALVFAIDVPSGLMGEDNGSVVSENIIRADRTFTFQFPKLSFLFPENEKYVGDWQVLDIGLHPKAIKNVATPYFMLDEDFIKEIIQPRGKFSHKGTFGHALLISGAYGKMGAAVLSSKSCLRSGVGLLTTHVPAKGVSVLQTAIPEAMVSIDESDTIFTGAINLRAFSAIGIGPAIGQADDTHQAFFELIKMSKTPMVIDADALNILGLHNDWIGMLPSGSILTPHPKEFERLAGEKSDGFQRLKKALEIAKQNQIFIVLKGAHSAIVCPDGEVYFNSTGNPGMATAGSGDVLTGIILGLLAQGYTSKDAALLGVYVHGLAGDFAAEQKGKISLIASDIVDNLGEAFMLLCV